MEIVEGGLRFDFLPEFKTIKFDDAPFYRKHFNSLPESKGVDILACSQKVVLMIEVKDFRNFEIENNWRTQANNNRMFDGRIEYSLDIEVAQKVAMSLTCLLGANTKKELSVNAKALDDFFQKFINKIALGYIKLQIVLFVEGVTDSYTRPKKVKLKALKDNIEKHLKWLNCDVFVEDCELHNNASFHVNNKIHEI